MSATNSRFQFWQNLRHEGAISNRFLPLRIYILFGKMIVAGVAAAFTVTALWGHYGGLVEGQAWIGRLAAGFPEVVMIGLCFIPIFCGYEKTGDSAERWYYVLLVAVLVHAGLIYSTAFVDKQIDKKVAKQQAERTSVTAQRQKEREQKNKADGEVKNEGLKVQAAEIQRIADLQINRNPMRRTVIQEDARKRIQALFESANKPIDDSYTPLPSAEDELKKLRNEIKAEMSAGEFGKWMLNFKDGADIYLESIFAIIVPFLLAAFGAGRVFHILREEGRHEEAAAGRIRTPAAKGAYHQEGTGALPSWNAESPSVGQPTRRFTVGFKGQTVDSTQASVQDKPGGAPRQ